MSRYRSIVNTNESVPITINISEDIKKGIKIYSTSDTSRELGGVLVGKVSEDASGFWTVDVENYIIAEHTNAHLSSVTFTAETWAQINDEMDRSYPNSKIVGWFHTHPGFGIFLSNMDIFIQDNFFNLPWQIAYVVDPCHKTDGFFVWKEGDIVKISENSFKNLNLNNENENEIPCETDNGAFENTENVQNEGTEPVFAEESSNKGINNIISKLEENPINRFMGKFSSLISFVLILLFIMLIIIIGLKYFEKNNITKDTIKAKITDVKNSLSGKTIKDNLD